MNRAVVGSCFVAALVVGPSRQAQAQRPTAQVPITLAPGGGIAGGLVRVIVAAPVVVLPDANREPLRIAKEGSTLRSIRVEGDFTYVAFSDPDYERRFGYIQTRFLEVLEPIRQETLDLSVPRAPAQPSPPSAQPQRPVPAPRVEQQEPVRARAVRVQPITEQSTERSRSSRFFLGGGLEGNGVVTVLTGTPGVTDSGLGGGVVIGYGFNRHWSLYGDVSTAKIEPSAGGSYTLAHVDIGTRVHFLSGPHKAVPFLQVAVSGRAKSVTSSSSSSTATSSGAGGSFGGGVNVHFNPAFAFSASATWSVGDFDKYQVDGRDVGGAKVNVVSARVHAGVVWFPAHGR